MLIISLKHSIYVILFVFFIQCFTLYASQTHNDYLLNQETFSNTQTLDFPHTLTYIYADMVEILYPNKIQFLGNVNLKKEKNILHADKLTILQDKKIDTPHTLYINGKIKYQNKHIFLTGNKGWINYYNNNLNLYDSKYHIFSSHIYGTADTIVQRKNNRYTIIKNGNLTSFTFKYNYWNITGSKIIYDYSHNNINIWNAYLKIRNIPILYFPYLSLPLNKKITY